jgi:hypothetical protein
VLSRFAAKKAPAGQWQIKTTSVKSPDRTLIEALKQRVVDCQDLPDLNPKAHFAIGKATEDASDGPIEDHTLPALRLLLFDDRSGMVYTISYFWETYSRAYLRWEIAHAGI